MAPCRLFRGALVALDVAARDRTLQGALGAASSDRCRVGRGNRVHGTGPADDPESFLQKKNRAEALRQSLPRLSPQHREVIDLAYYHGKSVKESLASARRP